MYYRGIFKPGVVVRIEVTGQADPATLSPLPLFSCRVPAGFPSPADDYIQKTLDLNEHLIKRPSATFLVRATGDSMQGAGVNDGALLIVDRSLDHKHNDIVIVAIDAALTCKRLDLRKRCFRSANDAYPPILIKDEEVIVWGIVTHCINHLCLRS